MLFINAVVAAAVALCWLMAAPQNTRVWGQRAGVACRAKGDADAPALGLDALAPLTRTPLYRWGLQGAVVLAILGAVDAGWSGDWHRLGVLTTDQEAAIRGLLALLGFFHIGAGLEPLVLWQMANLVGLATLQALYNWV